MVKKKKSGMASRAIQKPQRTRVFSKRLGWSLFTVLTSVILIAVAVWFVKQQSLTLDVVKPAEQLMPIRLVEIQGTLTHLDKSQILTVLRSLGRESSSDKETINFLTADLREVEKELESVPWVYRVKVRRIWPDKLIIDIEEQQAVAIWNDSQLVNRYGDLFQPDEITTTSLPLMSGPENELPYLLSTFAELQLMFEQADLQLKELHLSERRSWELKLTNGIYLDVGRKDLNLRVSRFIDLYPTLVSDNPAEIERVDLRYDTGLAVRRVEPETRQASL